jgi:hypothetical protein
MGIVQNAGDLFRAQDGDADRPLLGRGDLLVEPGLLKYPDVEKLQGRTINLNRRPGILLFVPQVEDVFPNLI